MREEYDRVLRIWLLRRRRLRRLLRPLPRRDNVHRYPVIKWFSEHARRRPFLWSFKRAQVVPAIYIGMVIGLLPIYGVQTLLAFAAALLLRANLTVSVALQFVNNPLTVVPLYALTGWVGATLMRQFDIGGNLPTAAFYANALFVGGIVVGFLFGVAADIGWRLIAWEARRLSTRLRRLKSEAGLNGASADDTPDPLR